MSQLDDLLSRSRSPGRFVERRSFTLSRAKAIEKQRAFALRLPRQYVLELVQAAVFAGATYLAVDTRADRLLMAWVGAPPLEPKQLEDLLDYLFADRTHAETRHLVQLAVGVNALLETKPKLVRIESGNGERSVRMDLDAKGEGSVGDVEDPIGGTYLLVEFNAGLFARWTTRRHVEEQHLIEERCLYTPVPILLNGAAPFGYRGSRHIEIFGARRQQPFDHGGRRGVIAVHTNPRAPTGFRMVVGGVWITTLPLDPLATTPLVGVVCDDNLRKTADHADIVLDHRYVRMLHAVQPHATTLMKLTEQGTYSPPRLPPVPSAAPEGDAAADMAESEPLPEPLPLLGVRGTTTLERLRQTRDLVFYTPPDRAAQLERPGDPATFPWRVLILTDGQATTLRAEVPDLALHRVAAASDLDFVRRMSGQRQSHRRAEITAADGSRIVLRLHTDGRLPAWGDGRPGVPFAVVADGQTVQLGTVEGRRVVLSGRKIPHEVRLDVSLRLPDVSLVLSLDEVPDSDVVNRILLSDIHAEAALQAAWSLAHPEDDEPDAALLIALAGQVGRPTFASGPGIHLHLPPGWPLALLETPCLPTPSGALPIRRALELCGSAETVTVVGLERTTTDLLEARIGFGHLDVPSLRGSIVCAVIRVGNRWLEHTRRSLDDLPAHAALVVTATFRAEPSEGWVVAHRIAPGLECWVTGTAEGNDLDWREAADMLFTLLRDVQDTQAWTRFALEAVTPLRARGRGRLALYQLAAHLKRLPQVVDIHPSLTRITARGGATASDEHLVRLTADERRAADPDESLPTLYDDPPSLWASLSSSDEGWLVRHHVRGELQGWLGLSVPYDATAGALLRTTTELVALIELGHDAPCHGLVSPTDTIAPTSHKLLTLEALQLYTRLEQLLREGSLSSAERAAAHGWAFAFAARAWRRTGALEGLAQALATLVPIPGPGDTQWGSALQWLGTSQSNRPDLPAGWTVPEAPARALPVATEPTRWLADRLDEAFPTIEIQVHWATRDGRVPVKLVPERSSRQSVLLLVDSTHSLVQRAGAGDRTARLLLLVECSRVAVRHNRWVGQPRMLLGAQQVILATTDS